MNSHIPEAIRKKTKTRNSLKRTTKTLRASRVDICRKVRWSFFFDMPPFPYHRLHQFLMNWAPVYRSIPIAACIPLIIKQICNCKKLQTIPYPTNETGQWSNASSLPSNKLNYVHYIHDVLWKIMNNMCMSYRTIIKTNVSNNKIMIVFAIDHDSSVCVFFLCMWYYFPLYWWKLSICYAKTLDHVIFCRKWYHFGTFSITWKFPWHLFYMSLCQPRNKLIEKMNLAIFR